MFCVAACPCKAVTKLFAVPYAQGSPVTLQMVQGHYILCSSRTVYLFIYKAHLDRWARWAMAHQTFLEALRTKLTFIEILAIRRLVCNNHTNA